MRAAAVALVAGVNASFLMPSLSVAGQPEPGLPEAFSATLKITSPEEGQVYGNPVIPIAVQLAPNAERSSARYNDRITFSLRTAGEGGEEGEGVEEEDLNKELLENLLPSVNMRMCVHMKGDKAYSCSKPNVDSLEIMAASMFRPAQGRQTVFAWMMRIPEEYRDQVRIGWW